MPIEIIKSTGATVSFKVAQYWKSDGAISWMAVSYTDSSLGQSCPKTETVAYQATLSTYTASCVNGNAAVAVYVHDGSFGGLTNINSSIPNQCGASHDAGKKVAYFYSVPCNVQCSPV
jgi:hypothetical protein